MADLHDGIPQPSALFEALDGLVEALSSEAGLTMSKRLAEQYSTAQQALYAEKGKRRGAEINAE